MGQNPHKHTYKTKTLQSLYTLMGAKIASLMEMK